MGFKQRRAGLKLKLAAKIGDDDRAYFREVVEPLIDGDRVEYVGEIEEARKAEFLGNAAGLVLPIDWPEPFGLVMIEAMACGTPVVAFNAGAVPEVLEDGLTGFVVDDIDGAVAAIARLDRLFRPSIRSRFEERFSVRAMAREYLRIYERLSAQQDTPGPVLVAA